MDEPVDRAGVREMYDAFPYPTPLAGDGLIMDVANMAAFLFRPGCLDGKYVLDAGCGSGHRLLGFAKRFAASRFLGVDLSAAPIQTARELAQRHRIANVEFQQCNLLRLDLPARFDFIVSTGVIHHLEDPQAGLANLCRHLAPDGHLALWLYHPFGEFQRLLERELVLTLWDRERASYDEGLAIIRALGISLAADRYSSAYAAKDDRVIDERSINVDGYLHPIVHTYRFGEALDLLHRCGMHWATVHSIHLGHDSRMLDLAQVSRKSILAFCLKDSDLFDSAAMVERYRELDNRDKLRAIELVTRPNGYMLVSGRGKADRLFDERICSGSVRFD